jgi:transposase
MGDPLAEVLNSMESRGRAGNLSAVEQYFGDRPEVKQAILAARKRKLSYNEIATALNKEPGVKLSGDAVGNWLKKQGVS